ncbi:MAG: class I SAM-dependent methyltransferase [Candidatus Hermodarchaeota archaeon]
MGSKKRTSAQSSNSIRKKYEDVGVTEYYEKHAQDYINPHFTQIKELLVKNHTKFDCFHVLDLCCGNGEVSQVLIELGYANVKGCDRISRPFEMYTPRCVGISWIPDELHESKTQLPLPDRYGSPPRKHIACGECKCVFWFQYGYPYLLPMNHLVTLSKELTKTFSVCVPYSFTPK